MKALLINCFKSLVSNPITDSVYTTLKDYKIPGFLPFKEQCHPRLNENQLDEVMLTAQHTAEDLGVKGREPLLPKIHAIMAPFKPEHLKNESYKQIIDQNPAYHLFYEAEEMIIIKHDELPGLLVKIKRPVDINKGVEKYSDANNFSFIFMQNDAEKMAFELRPAVAKLMREVIDEKGIKHVFVPNKLLHYTPKGVHCVLVKELEVYSEEETMVKLKELSQEEKYAIIGDMVDVISDTGYQDPYPRNVRLLKNTKVPMLAIMDTEAKGNIDCVAQMAKFGKKFTPFEPRREECDIALPGINSFLKAFKGSLLGVSPEDPYFKSLSSFPDKLQDKVFRCSRVYEDAKMYKGKEALKRLGISVFGMTASAVGLYSSYYAFSSSEGERV